MVAKSHFVKLPLKRKFDNSIQICLQHNLPIYLYDHSIHNSLSLSLSLSVYIYQFIQIINISNMSTKSYNNTHTHTHFTFKSHKKSRNWSSYGIFEMNSSHGMR